MTFCRVRAAGLAPEHARGHERIAHIAGPFEWFDARARVVGWQAALADAGWPVPEPVSGGWEGADGFAGAQPAPRPAETGPSPWSASPAARSREPVG